MKTHRRTFVPTSGALLAMLLATSLSAVTLPSAAADEGSHWWEQPFSLRTAPMSEAGCEADDADAVRGVVHAGWYGDWYLSDPMVRATQQRALRECGNIRGLRLIGYFDPGEMGDYLVLVDAQGRIRSNAWSLPRAAHPGAQAQNAEDSAAWFGYSSFLFERQRFAAGREWHGSVPPLTTRDGRTITTASGFSDEICAKSISGEINSEENSPVAAARLPRTLPAPLQSTLERAGARYREGGRDVVGKTGWATVRQCHVDTTSALYLQLLQTQIRNIYSTEFASPTARRQPLADLLDGIHLDNVGRTGFFQLRKNGFGDATLQAFRERAMSDARAAGRFDNACRDMAGMKSFALRSATVAELRSCFARIDDAQKGRPPIDRRAFWSGFIPLHLLKASIQNESLRYFHALYTQFKQTLGPDALVSGNLIPLLPGQLDFATFVDLPVFEWKYHGAYGLLTAPGDYPAGFAFLARLGTAASRTGHSIVSLYVPKTMSEKDARNGERSEFVEAIHRTLFFNLLANGAVLDSGHWFRDGYAPGTMHSRRELNRYVREHRNWLMQRQTVADVGLVFSPASQVADVSIDGFDPRGHNDDYYAWSNVLTERNESWDVVPDYALADRNLSHYRALILPGVTVLSDAQRAALKTYLFAGGALIVTGEAGHRKDANSLLLPKGEHFDRWLAEQRNEKTRICPGSSANRCDRSALLASLSLPRRIALQDESSALVRVMAGAQPGVHYIEFNRYKPLSQIRGALEPNTAAIRARVQLADAPASCLEVATLSDDGSELRGQSGEWGVVERAGTEGFDITLKPGSLRYFRSVMLRTAGCRG